MVQSEWSWMGVRCITIKIDSHAGGAAGKRQHEHAGSLSTKECIELVYTRLMQAPSFDEKLTDSARPMVHT